MRGKRFGLYYLRSIRRIIPAHAGQTRCIFSRVSTSSDHPRACGANPDSSWTRRSPSGSSPRMRGKRVGLRAVGLELRIIPAHAGQTDCLVLIICCVTDHPRACGANPLQCVIEVFQVGSSPRMRGKPVHLQQRFRIVRIIPAHAGQTFSEVQTVALSTDHPRACGANRGCMLRYVLQIGSSPRMRGKRDAGHGDNVARRIIPAHAGQTGARVQG